MRNALRYSNGNTINVRVTRDKLQLSHNKRVMHGPSKHVGRW